MQQAKLCDKISKDYRKNTRDNENDTCRDIGHDKQMPVGTSGPVKEMPVGTSDKIKEKNEKKQKI